LALAILSGLSVGNKTSIEVIGLAVSKRVPLLIAVGGTVVVVVGPVGATAVFGIPPNSLLNSLSSGLVVDGPVGAVFLGAKMFPIC